jgi:cytochrome c-type biogenesis protein CcmH
MTRGIEPLSAALATVLFASLAQAQNASDAVRAAPDPKALVGTPHGQPLAGEALEARTAEVSALLRCPVCQGLSVDDSPATMAQNMKAQVRDLLAAGYDRDQVLAYFERSYGEFVRLEPPLRGVNWLVWLAPVLGLLAGGAFVGWVLRGQRRATAGSGPGTAPADLPGADTLPDDPRLARYVLRVRELAYGWPGGVRPASSGAASMAPGAEAPTSPSPDGPA